MKYHPKMYLKGLKKTMKTLGRMIGTQTESNQVCPKCMSEMLLQHQPSQYL